MAELLSAEWVDDLAAAARAVPAGTVPEGVSVAVRVEVDDVGGYTVVFADGAVAVERDRPGDLVLRADAEAARALHEGRINAQEALATGRLRIGGDPASLHGLRDLGTLGDLFAALRSGTT